MLPNLRVIAASAMVMIAAIIGAFGVTAAVRASQHAASPLESLKGVTAFDERLDWNQFANPDSTRLYRIITSKAAQDEERARGGPFAPVDAADNDTGDTADTGTTGAITPAPAAIPPAPPPMVVAALPAPAPEIVAAPVVRPVAPAIDAAALIDLQIGSDPGSVLAMPSADEPLNLGIELLSLDAPIAAEDVPLPKKRPAQRVRARAKAAAPAPAPAVAPPGTFPFRSLLGSNS